VDLKKTAEIKGSNLNEVDTSNLLDMRMPVRLDYSGADL